MNNKLKTNTIPKKLVKNDGSQYITDLTDIAAEFNTYFVTLGNNTMTINNNSSLSTYMHKKYLTPNTHAHTLFMHPITYDETRKYITQLSPSKGPGPDGLKANVIKDLIDIITEPLTHIINMSFEQGVFPEPLKIARVVPIFKKGSPFEVNNYRPISVLSCISKIFEKAIHTRLHNYFTTNNVLYKRQYGFRKHMSTNTALLDVCNNLSKSLDNSEISFGVFIDISKAFDTVQHSILLDKLQNYGIRGTPYLLLESYLQNRKQYVSLQNTNSDPLSISQGVPQGSILGPLLFLIYINDMCNSLKSGTLSLFADDATLFVSNVSIINLAQTVNNELNHLHDWLTANKLALNLSKSCYTIFSSGQKQLGDYPTININNIPLQKCNKVKYLGVFIDNHLTWKEQISYTTSKINVLIYVFSKLRLFLPNRILYMLYYSLAYPHITYCIDVWGHAYPTNLKSLVISQKKLIKTMSSVPYSFHSTPLFLLWNILPLPQLIQYKTALTTYKFLKIRNQTVNCKFNEIQHNHSTRFSQNGLFIPRVLTNYGKKSIEYIGSTIWNSLPLDIRESSLNSFKEKLFRYFMSQLS